MTGSDEPLIIGTGASGIAVAAALIAAGHRPIMIDGGLTPDDAALARQRSAIEGEPPARTTDATGSKNNPGEKTWFGSNFASREHDTATLHYGDHVVSRASFAVGGLSRVWGGTFAFFRRSASWPAGTALDEVDIAAVRALVPSSVTNLDHPAGPVEDGAVPGSALSAKAMRAFVRSRASARWHVEPARLAIDSRPDSGERCTALGVCLNGCPRNSIWYAGDQLRRWVADKRVRYVSGFVVERIRETADTVEVLSSTGERIEAPRVYVAAGAISTASILVASGILESVTIRDTATAFTAAVSVGRNAARRMDKGHHGLSQWWVRSEDDMLAAQVYPPDVANAQRVAARVRPLARVPGLLEPVSSRLHPVIAYLDSSFSDPLTVARAGAAISVTGRTSRQSKKVFASYLGALSRVFARAGYLLPVFATEFSAPGTGYHFGASLPHGTATDSLGRLGGSERIHIVDSSVIPELEVGSVTPTVMANAMRIGRQSAPLIGAP